MRKLMLFAGLAITVLISGLFMTHLVCAEQSGTEPGTVSSDKEEEASPSSVTPASEETDSDAESKSGRIGGGHGGRPAPAMRPAARPAPRPPARPPVIGRPPRPETAWPSDTEAAWPSDTGGHLGPITQRPPGPRPPGPRITERPPGRSPAGPSSGRGE